tara:strand:+ start:94 stop:423 length:330 start_codon:yes stop_codon:yes gene_type:complete
MNLLLFFLLKIAVIVSVLIVYFVYDFYKNKQNKKTPFPPWKSLCPELWEVVGKNKCKNVNKIGNCSITGDMIMDFNDPIFKDKKKGNYFRCKWSKECGVSWDGIDNLCI